MSKRSKYNLHIGPVATIVVMIVVALMLGTLR